MKVLVKRVEEGKLSILAKKETYYVVVLDREQNILFLAKGNQLELAFREYERRCEKGMDTHCPTCDFMLSAEGVYSIQESKEFVHKIHRDEAIRIFEEVGLMNVWQEFVGKIHK